MKTSHTRRDFLNQVGRGMVTAAVGYEVASGLGLASAIAEEAPDALTFGELEPLVCFMQETPVDKLLPGLVEKLKSGTELGRLLAAAALANARTFGGEDYVGFHTMMALAPAFHMAQELPKELQPLPVFKVLYRNTNRIQERGGRKNEVLKMVKPIALSESQPIGERLREAVRQMNNQQAEAILAASSQHSPQDAFNDVLFAVHDQTEVHRVVLPYRAWDLLGLIGKNQAHTLLRQSVRYCVKAESWSQKYGKIESRTLLPNILEEYKLLARMPGDRRAEDKWIDELSQTFFKSSPEQAARAAAAALAEGFAPSDIGEAISLAANQLVLRDHGRTPREESLGKPPGSVHGDSIGVHASDSANAWRSMSRVTNPRNCFASIILGAYQVALDRTERGGDFANWQPLPLPRHVEEVKSTDAESLLRQADEAIRANLQGRVAGIVHRYGELGHPPRAMFDLLLRYAVSEDGALHAEKFYRTVTEEFTTGRPAFRWRHVVALARVTASEFGRPAPGVAEARSLLKV
jgi:hypothetical protein